MGSLRRTRSDSPTHGLQFCRASRWAGLAPEALPLDSIVPLRWLSRYSEYFLSSSRVPDSEAIDAQRTKENSHFPFYRCFPRSNLVISRGKQKDPHDNWRHYLGI